LVINDIKVADDGEYYCTAASAAGTSDNSNIARVIVYSEYIIYYFCHTNNNLF